MGNGGLAASGDMKRKGLSERRIAVRRNILKLSCDFGLLYEIFAKFFSARQIKVDEKYWPKLCC